MNTIEEALKDLSEGKMIVVMDDEDRENEGDIVVAAEFCTPEVVNFMSSEAKGLICVALTKDRAERLNFHPMVEDKTALHGTNFTVSVDYKHETSTGISAFDRSKTIKAISSDSSKPEDFGRPGHVFPMIAVNGGSLRRAGHTEASIDLMKLAGLKPVGVVCEIINEDGSMARRPELEIFAEKHDLKITTVKQLIAHRFQTESLVKCVAEAQLPSDYGDFVIKVYENKVDGKEHLALVKGDIKNSEDALIRVHSECMTGDVFGSKRCDCGDQLHNALCMIEKAGCGALVYMRQEGRGIGLINKIKAYALQEQGLDTVEANIHLGFPPDPRDYGVGAQIIADLGVKRFKLLTNNPQKRVGLESYGLTVTEQAPIEVSPNSHNKDYLLTKRDKMGHILHELDG
jgi:3,4-dihydroxy 2-butanone 4-phosphate synthase/GTP cyclohydrolase II